MQDKSGGGYVVSKPETATPITTWDELKAITGNGTYYLNGNIAAEDSTIISSFSGTLEGNGHKITGLTAPLFGTLSGATIKNLTIESEFEVNATTATDPTQTAGPDGSLYASGALAKATTGATVNNVKVTATLTVMSDKLTVGSDGKANQNISAAGFIGVAISGDVTFENCEFNGSIVNKALSSKNHSVGFASGYILAKSGYAGKWTFKYCTNNASLTANNKSGGFSGDTRNAKITATNCLQTGYLDVASNSGGFFGYMGSSGSLDADYCKNTGYIYDAGGAIGAIVGKADCKVDIQKCANEGVVSGGATNVSGADSVGGIMGGNRYTGASIIKDCTNSGLVVNSNTDSGAAGAILGSMSKASTISITDCSNTGSVMYGAYMDKIGGLIGNNGFFTSEQLSAIAANNTNNPSTNKTFNAAGVTPATSPFGAYTVSYRIGLDGGFTMTGNSVTMPINDAAKAKVSENNAIYGGAVTFGAVSGKARGEMTVGLPNNLNIKGCTGVMFYVDFSQTAGTAPQATVTLRGNDVRSQFNGKLGFYQNGNEWVSTTGSDRMTLPEHYKGWVYIPAQSYGYAGKDTPYVVVDAEGKFTDKFTVNNLNLYTNAYTYDENARVTFDEVLFVTNNVAPDAATASAASPAMLPDGTGYDVKARIGFDKTDYTTFTVDNGCKGESQGFKDGGFYIKQKTAGAQAQLDYPGFVQVAGAKGVLFYVDFSHTTVEPGKKPCASVTLDTNTYRSSAVTTVGAGYYLANGSSEWVKTKPISTCRMEVPVGFAGWIYVPATSYTATAVENGVFKDLAVFNNRLYTGNAACGTDGYILFDEIMFVYDCTHEATPTHTTASNATCEEAGNLEYWYCPTCRMYFKDEDCTEAYAANGWIVPAIAHKNAEHVTANNATCEEEGNLEYWYCEDCDTYFKDSACTEAYEADEWIVSAIEHKNAEHVTANDATCTAPGNYEYWYCEDCDTYFKNEDCTEAYEADEWVVAQLGHSYTGKYVTGDGEHAGQHGQKCVNGCEEVGAWANHDFSSGDCVCGESAPSITLSDIPYGENATFSVYADGELIQGDCGDYKIPYGAEVQIVYEPIEGYVMLVDGEVEDSYTLDLGELTGAVPVELPNGAFETKEKFTEYCLTAAPAVGAAGAYIAKVCYEDASGEKQVLSESEEPAEVSFEAWYLRTMIQFKEVEEGVDIRFVSMLDENLTDYKKAGFRLYFNGEFYTTVDTTEVYSSFIVDGDSVSIDEYSEADDYFFMANTTFGEECYDVAITVEPYVMLQDGTEIKGGLVGSFCPGDFVGGEG